MNTRYYLRLLRTLALAALTAAATAACSDDTDNDREPLTPPDADGGIPVTFTANINPGSDADPAAAPGTRTVLTPDGGGFTVTWKGKNDNPDDCDQIKIWAVKGTTTIGPLTYVPTTSGASSVLVPEDDSQKLILTEPGEWKFTAVYGFNLIYGVEPVVNLSDFPSQSAPGNTGHIASRDFSVATATHTVEANTAMPQDISLGFKHKLSALQLHVTNQSGEALTVREIRLSVDGGQIAHQRLYDIATGDWKATGGAKRDYLTLLIGAPAALPSGGTESQDLHMLFFPGYENETLTVTVITSRGEYSRTRPAPDGGFLAGKNYLTDITLRTSGLTAEEKWVEYISNKAELIAFRDKVNNYNSYSGKTVRLTADIDLSNETWTTPIGTDASKPFKGTFDGGGYSISGLNVDTGSEGYAGLFGYVNGGTVRNLRVSGTVTTTGDNAGGIAGFLYGGTVENCIFDGDVSGNGDVGGIAGWSSDNSRIAGCYTKGKVTATGVYVGGISGTNQSSTIDGCYSEAVVTANRIAGGIAGTNQNSTITHCYATGAISAKQQVGGIVGWNMNSITGCIALNPGLTRTSDSDTRFGRVVGNNQGSSTITNCGAYDGMTLPDGVTVTSAADGIHGTALPAADCLTPAAYTSRDFTEATATTPGWAFDPAATWTYLPWNKVFERWNIPAEKYRISVPAHLNGGGTN